MILETQLAIMSEWMSFDVDAGADDNEIPLADNQQEDADDELPESLQEDAEDELLELPREDKLGFNEIDCRENSSGGRYYCSFAEHRRSVSQQKIRNKGITEGPKSLVAAHQTPDEE